jgi:DNA-binding CsgD family transcriptional regulator
MGLARGLSAPEIGKELYISRDTVKNYLTRLYRRLGARSQAHAVSIAYERGILPVRDTPAGLGEVA